MKTYQILFVGGSNRGSFKVDGLAATVQGAWRNSTDFFDGEHDISFIEVEEENAEYLEELLDADESVVSYKES